MGWAILQDNVPTTRPGYICDILPAEKGIILLTLITLLGFVVVWLCSLFGGAFSKRIRLKRTCFIQSARGLTRLNLANDLSDAG